MKKIVDIEGMMCNHCKMSVEKALGAVAGVEKVSVDLEAKHAVVEGCCSVTECQLKKAVEDAGFEVKGLKDAECQSACGCGH